MRFLCHIFHDRLSLGKYRCQHDIHGSANRDNIKINMVACQPFRCNGRNKAFTFHPDKAVELFKALDMLVNRTDSAKIAAARHGNTCTAIPSQLCANKIIRCTQTGHQLKCFLTLQIDTVIFCFKCGGIQLSHLNTHLFENFELQSHIHNVRYILNNTRSIHHQGCRYNRYRCIFRAADCYLALKRMSAFDDIFLQRNLLLKSITTRIVVSASNLSHAVTDRHCLYT